MVKKPIPVTTIDEDSEEVHKEHTKPHWALTPATVGNIVHFYTRNPSRQYRGVEGPYAAIVTHVQVITSDVKVVQPSVSVTVFPGGDIHVPSYSVLDIIGVAEGEEHDNKDWWQWP